MTHLTHRLRRAAPGRALRSAALALALTGVAGTVRAGGAPSFGFADVSADAVVVTVDGAIDPAEGESRWQWRWQFERSDPEHRAQWHEAAVAGDLLLARPAGARGLEVVLRRMSETGPSQEVRILTFEDAAPAPLPVWESAARARAPAAGDSVLVAGALVFGDRLYDRTGYTGARQWLPVRRARVQWRTVGSDSLLVEGLTGPDGSFVLETEAPGAPAILSLVTTVADSLAGEVSVVDAGGAPHRIGLGLLDLAPGTVTDLGRLELADDGVASLVGAVHVLDLATDALDRLATGAPASIWPLAGPVAPIRWDPAAADGSTWFDGQTIVVSSPATGASDAWSDGAVLAAIGHGWLASRGAPVPTDWGWADEARTVEQAFARGLGWAFAGAVQLDRVERRLDADGGPILAPATLIVDLPSPPPLGFPASLEAALDLESARTEPGARAVLARGQRGAAVVATRLYDLLDGTASADSTSGVDDDAVEGDATAWWLAFAATLQSGGLVYESWHDAWSQAADPTDAVEATRLAVDEGGCALEIDAYESDDDPSAVISLDPWRQPSLSGSGVVINEIFLGDVDGVELANRGSTSVDIGGWTITARRNGFAATPARTFTVPSPRLLLPGRQVLVFEGTLNAGASEFDLAAPQWSSPWAPDEDGAVILRNASGNAVDFVRWDGDGGVDRSSEPVPAGTAFNGRLVAPADVRATLGRNDRSIDTNSSADFGIQSPTPGWPNTTEVRVHTLRPSGDVDHLVVNASGHTEVHARRVRDEGVTRLAALDAPAEAIVALRSGIGARADGAYAKSWTAAPDSQLVFRLDTATVSPTSTGLRVLAWIPASDLGVWPVRDLRAHALGLGTTADSVRVTWTTVGSTDSLRVRVGANVARTLAGNVTSTTLGLGLGTHVISVEPFLADRVGEARSVGIFVGPIPCLVQSGFELQDPAIFGVGSGFAPSDGPAVEGSRALRDAPVGGTYPDASRAVSELLVSVDLTSDARLSFVHAAHLVPDGDLARVEISIDGGLEWIELARFDGASHPVDANDPADWGDGVFTEQDWVLETIALGAYAGERARLRVRRTSNESGNSLGWWIDQWVLELGAHDGVYWVDDDGSDAIGCGLRERPWRTLVPALERVVEGDRIVLAAGRHDRAAAMADSSTPVIVPLPVGVELRGEGSDRTVIAAGPSGIAIASAGAGADSSLVRVRGLRIEGGTIGLRLRDLSAEIDSVDVVDADTSIVIVDARSTLRASVLARSAVGVRTQRSRVDLFGSTVVDHAVAVSMGASTDSLFAERTLLGRTSTALVRAEADTAFASIRCSGFFSSLVDFVGPLELDLLANRLLDPRFCDADAGDYSLAEDSPFLDHPWCLQVGARGPGCVAPIGTAAPPPVASSVRVWPPAPNPFNPRVRLAWEQPSAGSARVEIFDLRGRRVRVLHDAPVSPGRHELVWEGTDHDGRGVASGVYLVRLLVDGQAFVQRVALVR